MNVVPVHAPDTLPIIFERGLLGVYHDWCESFGSYPRSYDLLHADHLFSRLKNRSEAILLSHLSSYLLFLTYFVIFVDIVLLWEMSVSSGRMVCWQ